MELFEDLSVEGKLERIRQLAINAIERFGLPPKSTVVMINQSENVIYQVYNPISGERFTLRVHRDDYHSKESIQSELDWIVTLREEGIIKTPEPVPGYDGNLIQTVGLSGVPKARHCVLFRWIEGKSPAESRPLEHFGSLGEITARLHAHSRSWNRPVGFQRINWDFETMFGANPIWGPWHDAPGLDQEKITLLSELEAMLQQRLEAFGKSPYRFGLIHADLRLANLLIHERKISLIDFDDCGNGWYLYDLGTALSFIEDRPDVPDLVSTWVDGYRRVLEIPREDEEEIQTFIMLRRLLLTAWIASHSETDLAKELGKNFALGTCRMARIYLNSFK